MDRFLQLAAPGVVCEPGYPHMYFEYAHARDLWEYARGTPDKSNLNERNSRYFNAVLRILESGHENGIRAGIEHAMDLLNSESTLPRPLNSEIRSATTSGGLPDVDQAFVARFNRAFVAGRQSIDQLQSPGRWSASQLAKLHAEDPKLARSACRLKWAFNAKADLVIHTGPKTAVCVEIKLDSKTCVYKMSSDAKTLKMSQLGLQQFVLESLLGFTTRFALIGPTKVPAARPDDPMRSKVEALSWRRVFESVLGTDFPKTPADARSFTDRAVVRCYKDSPI
jgi:hypothetical protein